MCAEKELSWAGSGAAVLGAVPEGAGGVTLHKRRLREPFSPSKSLTETCGTVRDSPFSQRRATGQEEMAPSCWAGLGWILGKISHQNVKHWNRLPGEVVVTTSGGI